jgi:hypothetical protein
MHFTTSTSKLAAALLDPVRGVIERGLAGSALALGGPLGAFRRIVGRIMARVSRLRFAARRSRDRIGDPGPLLAGFRRQPVTE